MRSIFCTSILLFLALSVHAQSIRYVAPAGTGSEDGTGWSNAYPGNSPQVAIDEVSALGGGEVWVAAGTYYPNTAFDGSTTDVRKNAITLKSKVQLSLWRFQRK